MPAASMGAAAASALPSWPESAESSESWGEGGGIFRETRENGADEIIAVARYVVESMPQDLYLELEEALRYD